MTRILIAFATIVLGCAFVVWLLYMAILCLYRYPAMFSCIVLFGAIVALMSWSQEKYAQKEWRIGMGYETEDPKHVEFRKRHGIKAWYDKEGQ